MEGETGGVGQIVEFEAADENGIGVLSELGYFTSTLLHWTKAAPFGWDSVRGRKTASTTQLEERDRESAGERK